MSRKLRIVFPYVEAGVGHIMPMKAFVRAFREQHGDEFEIIETDFFKDSGDPDMIEYEKFFCKTVRQFATAPLYGWIVSVGGQLLPSSVNTWMMMKVTGRKCYKKCLAYMESLHPDIVFSTHWATNYYARHLTHRPLTIMYCPDCTFNHVFEDPCDLALISTKWGYRKAIKKKRRFNEDNLKYTSFLIRHDVFELPLDRWENRDRLGLPHDKFTIFMMEGGYGIGKMKPLCEALVKKDCPITIVAACGKNEELYQEFLKLEVNPNVTFVPLPFTERVLEYIAACDLFIGKGGNSIAEPTFFGHPSIVSKFSTTIEKEIAQFYIKEIGCALARLETPLILEQIEDFIAHPEKLTPLEEAAKKDHKRFGADDVVRLVYERIQRYQASLPEEEAK